MHSGKPCIGGSGVPALLAGYRRTLRKAGEMGLRVRDDGTAAVAYRSGLTRRVDTAVRMNVLDAMRRMNQRVMEEVGQQFSACGAVLDSKNRPSAVGEADR